MWRQISIGNRLLPDWTTSINRLLPVNNMNKKIVLSIIIVNYNTNMFTKKCLASLESIRANIYCEIIVVDNASQDNPKQLIQNNFPHVRFIRNRKNLGFSKANNQGIRTSKGEYILLLNPDTIVRKQAILETLSYIDHNHKAGIVTCKIILPDRNLDEACHRGFPTVWNAFCQFAGISSIFPQSPFFNGYHLGYQHMDKIHQIDSCSGAYMLIRRSVGERIGWLDEDYFWYGEDIDFCYRVKKAGFTIVYYPSVSIMHHRGVSSGIKKHSERYSPASKETKIRATYARFEVMRIFYRKHYADKYPTWLTKLVFTGIQLKENLTLFRLRQVKLGFGRL